MNLRNGDSKPRLQKPDSKKLSHVGSSTIHRI
jgi:hypothetical protein